jgi:hypothetical protein
VGVAQATERDAPLRMIDPAHLSPVLWAAASLNALVAPLTVDLFGKMLAVAIAGLL